MKIAIISFFHTESSLCLAKYLSLQGCEIDYFAITDIVHNNGAMAGIEYRSAAKLPGIHQLSKKDAPELLEWTEGLPIKLYLLRLWWFSEKSRLFNAPIWRISMSYIRKQKYDAINIVGQHPWVRIIHKLLVGENITHTLHEVGSHAANVDSDSLAEIIIKDRSKVILHSKSSYDRFMNINGADYRLCRIIPFGKFETNLLYEHDIDINHGLDLSKPTFLFLGYIKPYKGLDVLKRAVQMLDSESSNFNLIVAGAGEDGSLSYFKTLKNCYILNRFLNNDEMMKLFRICSVVVLPYHSASQTGIIPTCFLYDKPVIATSVGAFAESIKDGENGLLVAPESPKDFASAMLACIYSPQLISQLSKGAHAYGRGDEFDWNMIAQKTIDFIL